MGQRCCYAAWWAGQCIRFAWRSSGSRANNWGLVGAGVLGVAANASGVKVIFDQGIGGIFASGASGVVAAWILIFIFRLLISPWQIWKDGAWHGNHFIYNENRLVYTTTAQVADNNKAHQFRFKDAPPNALIHWYVEVTPTMAESQYDVGCQPTSLLHLPRTGGFQPASGTTRVNRKRDMCIATFVKNDNIPRIIRLYVTGWERC
jgi:hypothetical protein